MEGSKLAFRKVISEWLTGDLPYARKRDINIPLKSEKIITVIGPRRSGKTYFLYFVINELLKTEPKNNILYINFEDDRLINIKISDLDDIIPIFYEMANPDKEKNIYLFFDEIQNIENWEKYIRRLYDTKQFRIYLSGSSSKLLSREISTSLRGRNLEYVIMPLNFREYLEFNGKEYSYLTGFTDNKGYIISELRNYLEYGGYPEVVIEKNNDNKLRILRSYYNTIFSMDMAEHFNISEVNVLDAFLKYIISIYSKYFSISKIYGIFKSAGYKISKNKLLEFLYDSEEVFFMFYLKIYSRSENKKLSYRKKIYVIDSGIINSLKNEMSIPRLMENIVFLDLNKRGMENNFSIAYWKEYGKADGKEIDFVLYDSLKIIQLIQVTYISDISDINSREISALLAGARYFKCHDLLIITWDYEGYIEKNGEKIIFIPLWKWLLNLK
ncbi:hypothetical protein SE19_04760 [Acidiplasma aeolicum]|uniref:AAA family ATPase n=1 Tax=Acidiplasma aeolicum TaxID=507754 RepID=A0A0Q0VT59_9ARCH|nr:ATP-binding protein [Acidiplasma aeolicum]KPV46620.1 hypothetical protein SE19_04760 [Acidiplasma aeolicum]KQB34685.1 hypothetical protein AOG54_04015 [Acidiplasma aeolicum]